MQARYRVHKFGGTSVATAERIEAVVRIVGEDRQARPDGRTVVVTSALGGVTDELLAAIREAEQRTGGHRERLEGLRRRHEEVVSGVAEPSEVDALLDVLAPIFEEAEELLQGIYLLRQCTPRFSDAVLSVGERLAAPIISAALRAAGLDSEPLDARRLVVTDDEFGDAAVDQERTSEVVESAFGPMDPNRIPVVTGFIGATPEGVTTTLGRSGSDYTATILGGALGAEMVVIWTDVAGVLSADPRLVPSAFTLPRLTYPEAAELAHFGAKVLHPRTMRPLERAGIPLAIKNTASPETEGTVVTSEGDESAPPIKALTAVRVVSLVTLEGTGLLDVRDLTARTFSAISAVGMNVLMITQASSEGSLTFAVPGSDGEAVAAILRKTFERECERGDLRRIRLDADRAIIAAVGHRMRMRPGLAGKMFATLARARVNVDAIAEGASDHNLTCAVLDADAARAVDALHEAFALRMLRAHVVVLGTGTIGSRLLRLLGRQLASLREEGVSLRLVGVGDSRRLLWQPAGLEPERAIELLAEEPQRNGLVADELLHLMHDARLERLIVVDATASEGLPDRYADWLTMGAAVVTPNQRAFVDARQSARIHAAARDGEAPVLFDAAVGGGLSVLPTLRDLIRTGDRVEKISGAFSGTLSVVFQRLREGHPFSHAVRASFELGVTEADPRADLAGEDVARKLLILAAEMGRPLDPSSVRVESLVPEELREVPLHEFWRRLSEFDAAWEERAATISDGSAPLQYVATVSSDGASARVEAVSPDSPLARLEGASVLYAFTSARYSPQSLVVSGPGASADITTAVLLADIVRAAEAMR